MPGKLVAAHHTLADWDFMHGDTYRSLATDYYISEPSSLKFSGSTVSWVSAVLCRIPATLCLPQGEVRTWVRRNTGYGYPIMFRNQAPLGSPDYQNFYSTSLHAYGVRLYRWVGGGATNVDNTSCYTAINEWVHYRFFWYNGKTPGDVPALCLDVYREVSGEWVKQGSTLYDTLNYWKDSSVNRCGVFPLLATGHQQWYDDTEIWGPV